MSKDKQSQEDIFDNVYKEYKEYETFYKAAAKENEEKRKDFEQFVLKNADNQEKIMEEIFNLNESPIQQQNDLINLQKKLLYTYEALEQVIEVPVEIAKQIKEIQKNTKNTYTVQKGELHEVDPEHNKKVREMTRERYKKTVDEFLENSKG